ncbi:MAG TPA: WecB/TagA/CpsF family glycosyltransferase, partial [Nitrospira sp.]|nr:WecB/TagA/CpsF family glycosyltransferase [Nitrospira sp.]
PSHNLLGVPISVVDLSLAKRLVAAASQQSGGYVGVCNVHSVVSAGRDHELNQALAGSLFNTADGMPLVWALRLLGYRSAVRVYGQALMESLFSSLETRRHYLIGSTETVQEQLVRNLGWQFPEAQVVGRWVPPFSGELPELPDRVRMEVSSARPHVVWVGLGCPRQEKWMARHWRALAPAVLIGVGAAFDFLAGTRHPAPGWMRRAGLEWLFRLGSEPRRLAWRYLSTNPVYVCRMAAQLVRERPRVRGRL